MDSKTLTISLFNNSEKLVQILLEFSQQIVEGYKFVLAKFLLKKTPLSQPKSVIFAKIRVELFDRILRLCTKCDRSIMCKNVHLMRPFNMLPRAVTNLDITASVAHCGA